MKISKLTHNFHSADAAMRRIMFGGVSLVAIYNLGCIGLRPYAEDPQAKDIHQAFQVEIVDSNGKQTVFRNEDENFESILADADIRPKAKSIDEVETQAIAMIRQQPQLYSLRVGGRDVTDGETYIFSTPQGRGMYTEDARGRKVPVSALPLGTAALNSKAIRYIREQAEIYKQFDQTAKPPETAIGITWRAVTDTWYSLPPVRYVYDNLPRFKY